MTPIPANAVANFRYDLINTSDSFLVLEEVSKYFRNFQALDRVDLEIPKGSTIALIGASGSGKSTLLRILGGFEQPSSGRIWIEGENAADIPSQARNIGFVFQDYALFSHLTVAENIRFGLEIKNWSVADQTRRVAELLEFIKLTPYANTYPKQLSGGQQQRVALARAIAAKPALLLLDEPFGALDRKIRSEFREWLRDLPIADPTHEVTTIFVTHDHQEAMEIASEIVVLEQGRVKYRVTPEEFYYCVLQAGELPAGPIPSATPQKSSDPRPDLRRKRVILPPDLIDTNITGPLPQAGSA
jgi:sulfate/thiosulfate transport system ATP-binding protein